MRIAVYCGSFDPLHIGHQAIMKVITDSPEFDWLYLIVSPQNPFKDPSKAFSAQGRFDAAVEAVRRHPELHVWVDDIELSMPAPQYTIRTLDALKEREPGNDFTLVIGGDNLDCILKWRDAGRILKEYGVVAYPREGYDVKALRDALMASDADYKIRLIDAPMVNISSTEIRQGLEEGRDMSDVMM